jgi:DNA-binding response OmpR family regulator
VKQPTILLSDDQVFCAEIVWHTLHPLGCEMLYVEEKAEALTRLPEIRPDLIITDLGSPGLNGFDFIRRVRAYDDRIPILVVSGTLDDGQNRAIALQLGACRCVNKPFDCEKLVEIVRRTLRSRGVYVP